MPGGHLHCPLWQVEEPVQCDNVRSYWGQLGCPCRSPCHRHRNCLHQNLCPCICAQFFKWRIRMVGHIDTFLPDSKLEPRIISRWEPKLTRDVSTCCRMFHNCRRCHKSCRYTRRCNRMASKLLHWLLQAPQSFQSIWCPCMFH